MTKRLRLNDARFFALRERQIITVLTDRWHGPVPPDDAGRGDLQTLLECAAARGNADHVERLARKWAPWMEDAERENVVQEALATFPDRDLDRVAAKLHLSMADRQRLKVTVIGAVDVAGKEARERARNDRRNERKREKRRKQRAAADAARKADDLTWQDRAVCSAMAGEGWTTPKKIAETIANWRTFRPQRKRKRRDGSLVRMVHKILNRLRDHEPPLIEDHPDPPRTTTGLKIRHVRRIDERPDNAVATRKSALCTESALPREENSACNP